MRFRGNKAEREAEAFRRQARQTLGITARTTPIPEGNDPQREHREQQRLATVHDASKPSACRLCGRTVQPGSDGWAEVDGWKCCGRCLALLPDGLAAVLADVLHVEVAEDEAVDLAEQLGCGNPSAFVGGRATDPGNRDRWAHVDPTFVEQAPSVLAKLRARGTPRVNTFHSGCAMCGVARSSSWTVTPFKMGRHGQRMAACATCGPWVARTSHSEQSWRPALLAAAVGMRKAHMEFDLGVRAFFEVEPVDVAGTSSRWAYLGPTRAKLRAKVVQTNPRWLLALTDTEKRVLAIQAVLAEAPSRPKLADV